jgi:hypothetical protein
MATDTVDTAQETLFDMPNTPEEFGVLLPPSNLRRIDFSGLDYDTARRAMLEYIKTYFPQTFNDFVASNGIMMLVEAFAAVVAKLALRGDLLAFDSFLTSAMSEAAVVNHLALINQRIKRQTPAIIDVECTVDQPLFTNLEIPPGTSFSVQGPDNKPIVYEIFRAPNDWNGAIVIPAGKRGVIAWGVQGQFAAEAIFVSAGGPNQQYTVTATDILESPLFVSVTVGDTSEDWLVVGEPIERFGPTDRVVEVIFIESQATFRFGDDVTGRAPVAGSHIGVRYRMGGGRRGRIGVGQIQVGRQMVPNAPANTTTLVHFRNITPSNGGTDRESLDDAKRRAPRDFATQRSIVTSSDYAQMASNFSHPAYGSISKAVATVRTSLNANLVEIYALALGPDNTPTTPNAGLKIGLATFFNDLNVLTDHVVVKDGALKPIDIDLNVIMDRNADASVVKTRVEQAITDFFDITQWDMGEPLYISKLIDAINRIDGVAYVDLFKPLNNILQTGQLADPDSAGVGINEVIVEGSRRTGYYYQKVSTR